VLRLFGAFYAVGSVAGLRKAAMWALMDRMIAAIGAPDPRETRAAMRRTAWLSANLVLVGGGGIALALLLAPAAPLFLLGAALQALYLGVLAPRFLDPWDAPDEQGRAATRRAFWLHLGVTAVVLAAWWRGLLLPVTEAGGLLLGLGFGFCLALGGFALRQWRAARPLPGQGATSFQAPPRRTGLLLMPSWRDGALFDAATLEPLPEWETDALLSREEFRATEAWLALFAELADPDDPWRCALRAPADASRLEAAGRPILDSLRTRLGAEAVDFAPLPRRRAPERMARRVRVAAVLGEWPLWSLDEDPEMPRPIDPNGFGLSWSLAQALLDWDSELQNAVEWESDDRLPPWSPAEREAHAAAGLRLAQRLVAELAATGRGEVVVTALAADGSEVTVAP
jgi:hypothetical protein